MITILGFIKKEFAQALRDPRMKVLLFGVPIFQLLIFGYAISTEIKNLKFSIYHSPNDLLSRDIEKRLLASTWFIRSKNMASDPFQSIQAGNSDISIVMPPDGLERAFSNNDAQIQLLINGVNVMAARSIELYASAIINQSIKNWKGMATTPPQITFTTRMLYNPSMESSLFMVPAVMCMVLTVITILLTSMSISKEKETGTFETIIANPISPSEILLGKTLPFIIIGIVDAIIIVCAALLIFDVPFRGSIWQLAIASIVFIFTTVSIGTFISTIAKNQQQAMMGSFTFLFPSILLSGIMVPISNLPDWLKMIAYTIPLRHYILLIRNIMLKGGSMEVFWTNLFYLGVIGILIMFVAVKRFRTSL